jgi:hypothetical protein
VVSSSKHANAASATITIRGPVHLLPAAISANQLEPRYDQLDENRSGRSVTILATDAGVNLKTDSPVRP